MLPFWEAVATRDERRALIESALHVAVGLDAPELATALLRPFRADELAPRCAPTFAALMKRYCASWARSLLSEWIASDHAWRGPSANHPDVWLESVLRFSNALVEAGEAGMTAARMMVSSHWSPCDIPSRKHCP